MKKYLYVDKNFYIYYINILAIKSDVFFPCFPAYETHFLFNGHLGSFRVEKSLLELEVHLFSGDKGEFLKRTAGRKKVRKGRGKKRAILAN